MSRGKWSTEVWGLPHYCIRTYDLPKLLVLIFMNLASGFNVYTFIMVISSFFMIQICFFFFLSHWDDPFIPPLYCLLHQCCVCDCNPH